MLQKISRSEFLMAESEPTTRFAAAESVVINDYSKSKDPLLEQAEQVVQLFHRKVFTERKINIRKVRRSVRP